jgi:hypothetical protein
MGPKLSDENFTPRGSKEDEEREDKFNRNLSYSTKPTRTLSKLPLASAGPLSSIPNFNTN